MLCVLLAAAALACATVFAFGCGFGHEKSDPVLPHLISENESELYPERPVNAFPATEAVRGTRTEREQMEYLPEILYNKRKPDFTGASAKVKQAYDAAVQLLDTYIRNDFTPFERVHAIHDWLTYYVEYDFALAARGDAANGNDPAFGLEGALINRKAVCDGYAKAMRLLCGIEGIPCIRVTGTFTDDDGQAVNHAWNKVCLDGVWYNVDATMDVWHVADGKTRFGVINHGYFLVSDDAMSDGVAGRHEIDDDSTANPVNYVCVENYDFHAKTPLGFGEYRMEITSQDELNSVFTYVKKQKGKIGRLELKLNFPEYDKSNLLRANAYVSQISEAYKKVKDRDYAFDPDKGYYPYRRYPNGVFVFLFYR
ncbi:MAG: hypothetical protein K2L51_02785 [Clostridiales bacterium]|nr:hypothetical protein [Clostridiales bacterium]